MVEFVDGRCVGGVKWVMHFLVSVKINYPLDQNPTSVEITGFKPPRKIYENMYLHIFFYLLYLSCNQRKAITSNLSNFIHGEHLKGNREIATTCNREIAPRCI